MIYSQQLRDRRWQQKRLKILERDQWRCQREGCKARDVDEVMLVVHHRTYRDGKKPWEYADADLITYCERCHDDVHGRRATPITDFMEGEFYTWSEIKQHFGFTPTPYLTNAKGRIVCGTFRKDLNPDAPTIILPGKAKKHWADNARLLCRQRQAIPVFTKEAGLPWEYHGLFRGEGWTQNQIEVGIHSKRAREREEPISLVLYLEHVSS